MGTLDFSSSYRSLLFFFFQAEDGIRDGRVTGVQTCALPILYLPKSWTGDPARCEAAGIPGHVAFATKPQLARLMIERAVSVRVPFAWVAADERSEERRVGKECRCRWAREKGEKESVRMKSVS